MLDVRCSSFRYKSLAHRRGFTLLEVLVALAVLGIAVTVVFQLFSAISRPFRLRKIMWRFPCGPRPACGNCSTTGN